MSLGQLLVLFAIGIDAYAAMVLVRAAWTKPTLGILGWAAFTATAALAVAVITGFLFFTGQELSFDARQALRLLLMVIVSVPAGLFVLAYHLGRLG